MPAVEPPGDEAAKNATATAPNILAIHHFLNWRRDFSGLRLAFQLKTPAVANALSFSASYGALNMLACHLADHRRRGLTDEQLPLPSWLHTTPAVESAPAVNRPSGLQTAAYDPPFASFIPPVKYQLGDQLQAIAFSDPPALSAVAGYRTGDFNRGSAEAPEDSAVAGDSNRGRSVISDLQTPANANAPPAGDQSRDFIGGSAESVLQTPAPPTPLLFPSIPNNIAPNMPGSNDEAAGASAVMNRPPAPVDMMTSSSRSFPLPPATLPPFSYFTWGDSRNRLGNGNGMTRDLLSTFHDSIMNAEYGLSQRNHRDSTSGGDAAAPSAPLDAEEENGAQVGGAAAAPSAPLDVEEEDGAQIEGAAAGSLVASDANAAEWPPLSDTKPPYRKRSRDRSTPP